MALWISYVNRPLVERYTIVYKGSPMTGYGQKRWRRDPGQDTMDPPLWDEGFTKHIERHYTL